MSQPMAYTQHWDRIRKWLRSHAPATSFLLLVLGQQQKCMSSMGTQLRCRTSLPRKMEASCLRRPQAAYLQPRQKGHAELVSDRQCSRWSYVEMRPWCCLPVVTADMGGRGQGLKNLPGGKKTCAANKTTSQAPKPVSS